MKQTILLAFAALAIPASAASINWNMSSGGDSNWMVNSDNQKITGTAYLLLTDDVTDFTSEQAIQDVSLGFATITDGVNKTMQTATNDALTAPTKYTFSLIIYDTAKSEYFVAGSTKTEAAYNQGADIDHYGTATSISFNAKDLYATSTYRGTQTFHSVPEPSTAALALAGLALLLKRRRA